MLSSRKPGYLGGVTLLGLIFSAPSVLLAVGVLWAGINMRAWPLPQLPGFGPRSFHNPLHSLTFWRNRFVHFQYFLSKAGTGGEWTIVLIDTETGETEKIATSLSGPGWIRTFVADDRLWIAREKQAFELVDGVLKEVPYFEESTSSQQFVHEGRPSFIRENRKRPTVQSLVDGRFSSIGNLKIPRGNQNWLVDGRSFRTQGASSIQVISINDQVHLFVRNDGRLLYRQGLEFELDLESKSDPPTKPVTAAEESKRGPSEDSSETTAEELINWSVVRLKSAVGFPGINHVLNGLLIDGKPAALIVDGVPTGNAAGRLYSFDGKSWAELTSTPFPFGSSSFLTVSRTDGQKSYVVVGTSTGDTYLYTAEGTGLQLASGSSAKKIWAYDRQNSVYVDLEFYGTLVGISLMLAILQAGGIWLLMRFYTQPEYAFGVETVRLSSLLWRGVARLIDLGLILGTTIGLGWLMTKDFDWNAFFEALNLHVNHPTTETAKRIAIVLIAWMLAVVIGILITQAKWSATPGKWICRLRTVRTTLRPCGFARSLVRELVFVIDCVYAFCWSPGILAIALTDRRQRLGDLVADTIVIESKSQ